MLDVSTRWNSCHDMLSRAEELKPALKFLAQDEYFASLMLSPKEWTMVSDALRLLRSLKKTSDVLEGDQ